MEKMEMEKPNSQSQIHPSRKAIGVILAIALLTTILVPILISNFSVSGNNTKPSFIKRLQPQSK